jgi:tRNA A-37 threonylcarbamoyl transferase component Bud32
MSERSAATPEEAKLLTREGLDSVAGAFAYAGGEPLAKPGLGTRRRIRLRLTDDSGRPVDWYLKRYGPQPWPARVRNNLLGAARDSPARREFRNICRLRAAGVQTARPIAFEEEEDLWGVRRSYIVMSAVPGDALERCFDDFLRRCSAAELERFNAGLVELVRGLHAAGLVHRDLYASHIFLDAAAGGPGLYLIDLARAFAPRWRRFRWRVKDLAQLKYSMPSEWLEKHWEAFLGGYLADAREDTRRWAKAVDRKAADMLRRHRKRQPDSR